MRDLEKFVDELFNKYKRTKEIQELREEIFSNLEARIKDNMNSGLDYNEAYDEAIRNIDNIDMLIEGNKRIYINRYIKELTQVGLLYILIGWIITIPLRIKITIMMVNEMFTVGLIIVGIIYILLSMIYKNDEKSLSKISIINYNKINTIKKYTWIIWGIFIFLKTIFTFGLYFASNIWFSRPIHIDGPYQFAMMVISFVLPLLSIILPLFMNRAYKLLNEYEVK